MKKYNYMFWENHKQEIIDLLRNNFSKKYVMDYIANKYDYYPDLSQLNKKIKEWGVELK